MKKLILAIVLIFATLNVYSEEAGWGENLPCEDSPMWGMSGPWGYFMTIDGCPFVIEYYVGYFATTNRLMLEIVNIHQLSNDPDCSYRNIPISSIYQQASVDLFIRHADDNNVGDGVTFNLFKADCISIWFKDQMSPDPNPNLNILNFDPGKIIPIINLDEMVGSIIPSLPGPNDPLVIPVYGGWSNCIDQVCCIKTYSVEWNLDFDQILKITAYPGDYAWRTTCPEVNCEPSCDWLDFTWENGQFVYEKKMIPKDNYNKLKVYPNPTNNQINIDLPAGFGESVLLEIIDVEGNILKTEIVKPENYIINFGIDQNSGTYLYKITYSSGKIYTGQFKVEK